MALEGNAGLRLIGRDENKIECLKSLLEKDAEYLEICVNDLNEDVDFDLLTKDTDILFHLISTTRPATSNMDIPMEIEDNVVFTAKLLDSCVKNDVKRIVFFSSGGTVYGKGGAFPLKEESPTNPISSYGMQKLSIEKLLYIYNYLYGLDYKVIRLSNPYGPYQRPDGQLGVVSTFIYKTLKGETIDIYGDGSVIRDYIYIDDAIRGVLNIARDNSEHRVVNLGSGYGKSVKEVLDAIVRTVGITPSIRYLPGRMGDIPVNYLDAGRYESCYGSLITVPFEEGIIRTCEHIKWENGL